MKTAWNDISPDFVAKGLTKCMFCVSDDMNLTDDDSDAVWQEDDENSSSGGWWCLINWLVCL
jgi:hypothetical protein